MNKFIRKSLEPGEEIVHNGRLHWSYVAGKVIGAWVLMVGGLLLVIYALNKGGDIPAGEQDGGAAKLCAFVRWMGVALIVLGIVLRLCARVLRTRTEFVVTRTRLIQKDGIVTVSMTEIPLYKVESVEMRQGLLDRIWNAGTLVLTGSGGTPHVIKHVYDPMAVRQAIVRNLRDVDKTAAAAADKAQGETPMAQQIPRPLPPAGGGAQQQQEQQQQQ